METESCSILIECPTCGKKTNGWEENQYDGVIEYYLKKIKQQTEDRATELYQIRTNLEEIKDRIFGNAVGYLQETITILDLKRACPYDKFSEEMASKHGTDIICEVIENSVTCGKISISVKHHEKWNSDFIRQLEDNISHDQADAGMLVTTSFPKEALNNKTWTTRDSYGKLILLVKPEFAPVAYYAIRQIVIQLKSIQTYLDSRLVKDGN